MDPCYGRAVSAPQQKTVVVTGASRGIGQAIASRFLVSGWRVLALARTEQALEPLRRLGDVSFIAFDAADSGSVLASARAVLTATPRLDALVNNAGIALSAPLAKTSTDDFLRIQAVNVTAPFLLTRELLPALLAAKGRVVNICSTAARKGFKYTSAYCASKHALLGLTRALATELGHKGVTVNAVSPGWTETDMLAASVDRIASSTGRSKDDARAAITAMNPMGRAVQPTEVAGLVHYLCDSPDAAAITGADYLIDAGETV